MKSTTTIIAIIAGSIITAVAAPGVLAYNGETCTNQYGTAVECPSNEIVVNKKVRHPSNPTVFVENLTANDAAYSPDNEVEYDIAVTNTSSIDYATVTVIDIFPEDTEFVSGPGRYEANERKLTYEISQLKAGTTVHNRVLVKLKGKAAFPEDITCDVVNTVRVTAPNNNSDDDTARLCVQTKVLGATTLPVAGFEDYAFMIPFMALAIIGFGILAKGAIRP